MKLIGTLCIFMFLTPGYSQNAATDKVASANAKAEALMGEVEQSKGSPYIMNTHIAELTNAMIFGPVDERTRRDIAIRLIKIHRTLGNTGVDLANKKRIFEAIGINDNGPESHKLFLDEMDSPSKEVMFAAVREINARGLHGDDIYDKVESLGKKGLLSETATLVHLGYANPSRGIKEIVKFLKTTQSLAKFVSVAVVLPYGYYDDPDTLDVIIDRYEEFKTKPPYDKESAEYTPDRAISFKDLWKYVDVREGKRLQLALEILKDQGVCDYRNLPQLSRRLASNEPITRQAVTDFLASQIASGNLEKDKVRPILEEASRKETDPKLRRRMDEILVTIKGRDKK